MKRMIKWVFGGLFGGLFIVLMVYAGIYGYRYQQYRAELSVYRDLGYPTNMEELRAWDTVDDPELNAAIPIHEAFSLLNHDYSDELLLPVSGMTEIDIEPNEPYSNEVIRDIGILLELNKESLELLHASTHLEKYRSELTGGTWSLEHMDTGVPLREVVRFLSEQVIYRSQTGDIEGAIDSIGVQFWLSRLYGQYPDGSSFMIAHAVDGISMASVETLVNKYILSDEHLVTLLALLNQHSKVRSHKRSYVGNAIDFDSVIASSDPNYYSLEEHGLSTSLDRANAIFEYVLHNASKLSLEYPDALLGYLRAYRIQVEILDHERWFDISENLLDPPGSTFPEYIMSPALTGFSKTVFMDRAKTTAVMTSLQVERYRIKHGRLPESLGDLVPEFIESVPRGFFVDEPIGYEVTDDGYVIYSVGESRVEEVKAKSYDEECDCVELWRYGFKRYLK